MSLLSTKNYIFISLTNLPEIVKNSGKYKSLANEYKYSKKNQADTFYRSL